MGNGSNLLFDDKGFDGAVIFTTKMTSCQYLYKDGAVYVNVGCGKSLTELSAEVGKKHSLSGLEFAYGIPGTVGGMVKQNAGAFGYEIADRLSSAHCYLVDEGRIVELTREDMRFGYRSSILSDKRTILISASFDLLNIDPDEINAQIASFRKKRIDTQPVEYPS